MKSENRHTDKKYNGENKYLLIEFQILFQKQQLIFKTY